MPHNKHMLKHTRKTSDCGIHFFYDKKHCTKTAKKLDSQNCLQNHVKNAKTTKFLLQLAFYTSIRRSCKVLSFCDFWFEFYDKFCSPLPNHRLSRHQLITKIENHNLDAKLKIRVSFMEL